MSRSCADRTAWVRPRQLGLQITAGPQLHALRRSNNRAASETISLDYCSEEEEEEDLFAK